MQVNKERVDYRTLELQAKEHEKIQKKMEQEKLEQLKEIQLEKLRSRVRVVAPRYSTMERGWGDGGWERGMRMRRGWEGAGGRGKEERKESNCFVATRNALSRGPFLLLLRFVIFLRSSML